MSNRLTSQDWIDFGIRTLAVDGFESLKADILSKRLGVTRGSFYWHFEDLAAFHQRIVDQWKTTSTEEIILAVETHDDPDARLRDLLIRAFGTRSDIDLQMCTWAQFNEVAAHAVVDITRRRQDYIASLIEACGVPSADAPVRAQLLYWSYLGAVQQGAHLEGLQLARVVEELGTLATRKV